MPPALNITDQPQVLNSSYTLSSSTALQEITEDVTRIVKDSLASLAEKDADLFRLHEEKMKLISLVEGLGSEKEKLSTQLHAAVDALQQLESGAKDLQKKFLEQQRQLKAIQKETNALALGCGLSSSAPSSLCSSNLQPEDQSTLLNAEDMQDIVWTLKRCAQQTHPIYHVELPQLQDKLHRASTASHRNWQIAYDGLVQAERRERQLIVDEGIRSLPLLFAARRQIKLVEYCDGIEKEIQAAIILHEQEKNTMTEQHRSELAYRIRELNRKRETIKKLEAENETKNETIVLTNSIYSQHAKKALLWIDFLESKVQLLQRRCDSAEFMWRKSNVQHAKDFQVLQTAMQRRISELNEQHATLDAHSKKQASTITKQEKLADSYAQRMTISTEKINTLNKEFEDFKEKHKLYQQEEQQKRQKLETTIQEQKSTIMSLEERASLHEQQCSRLVLQETILQKEKDALQKRVGALTAMVETLQPAAARGETLPLIVQRCDEQIASLTEQLAAMKDSARSEMLEATERIRILEEEKVSRAADIQHLNGQLKRERQKHERETELAASELKKVRRMMNSLCEEKEGYVRQLDMERSARKVFENQHQLETTVVKKLIDRVDKAEKEEMEASMVQSERDTLQKKVIMLEEACKQNAAVISELRECVFAERQLTSQLLSSMSSPVKAFAPQCSVIDSTPS